MSIKVLVNGAKGRMGQKVVVAVDGDPALILVDRVDCAEAFAAILSTTTAEVVVDFTNADSVYQNTRSIIDQNLHPVIGSSGLLPEEVSELQQLCAEKKLGGIIAPNFSIGATLMMCWAKEAARYFDQAEIIEMHHTGKLDAPSGTAVKTAEMINQGRERAVELPPSKEILPGSRGAVLGDVPIHAVRIPGVVAKQQVILGAQGETLTIDHDSIDRQCFMPGVVMACKKVVQMDSLVYGLETLMNL